MTEAPPRRGSVARAAGRALVSGALVSVLVVALGQLAGLALFLAEGANGAYAGFARLGALYTEAFHRVPFSLELEVPGSAVLGTTAFAVRVSIAFLLVTFGAAALLWRAGRRAARDVAAGWRPLVGAMVAPAYAIGPLALAAVARGRVELPVDIGIGANAVDVAVDPLPALMLPLAIAAAAGALGALAARGDASSSSAAWASVRRVVGAGVGAFVLALAFAIVGLLALAALRPTYLKAYLAPVTAPDSPKGRVVVSAQYGLLLPNQAAWVLIPSMGACDEAVVDGDATPFLCYWRVPTRVPIGFGIDAGFDATAPGFRPPSDWYLAFLLVPVGATVWGGARAGAGERRIGARVLHGAACGVPFAALVAAVTALSRVDVALRGGFLGTRELTLSLGPEIVRGTATAAAFGVLGGALGGLLWPVLRPAQDEGVGDIDA
jgi:hypothetical protein